MNRFVLILIKVIASASAVVAVAGAGAQGRQPFEPEMVHIPGGTFLMGNQKCGEADMPSWKMDECPQHRVRIPPFEASKYEITRDQWEACVRDNGCDGSKQQKVGGEGWDKGNWPATYISWNDADAYVVWLRRKTGKAYRLLTEAEWEYAARAGSSTRYGWGDEEPVCDETSPKGANFRACGHRMRSVGSFRPNAFGLHDMHGNVWEWVKDCWHHSYEGAPTDGSAWTTNCAENLRIFRGGALSEDAQGVRSAVRTRRDAEDRYSDVGFRVARSP